MKQTHVRNVAPMLAARRRQIDQQKADKAIAVLVGLGWTYDGHVIEPPVKPLVNADANG